MLLLIWQLCQFSFSPWYWIYSQHKPLQIRSKYYSITYQYYVFTLVWILQTQISLRFSFHTCVGTVKKQCNCWLGKVSLLTLSTIIIVRRIGGHNGPLKYLRFDHWWCIHGLQCRSKHACQKNGLSSVAYVLGGPVYKTYIQFFLVDSFQFNNVEILLRGL